MGGPILALSDDPQSTIAWDSGRAAKEWPDRELDSRAGDTVRLLHERRISGTRAKIDLLALTASGVFVIDAKRYVGKRRALVVEGGLIRPRVEKLLVGSRNQTELVDGVIKQVELVQGLVGEGNPGPRCPLLPRGGWPLIGGAVTVSGVDVLWPKKLCRQLAAEGLLATAIGRARLIWRSPYLRPEP